MARKPSYSIITVLGSIASFLLVRSWLKRRNPSKSIPKLAENADNLEFPQYRAHVYFAAPEQCLLAAKDAAVDAGCIDITEISNNVLTLSVPVQNTSSIELKVTCLALGSRHTRVVISPAHPDGGNDLRELESIVAELQSYMDSRLTGG